MELILLALVLVLVVLLVWALSRQQKVIETRMVERIVEVEVAQGKDAAHVARAAGIPPRLDNCEEVDLSKLPPRQSKWTHPEDPE